VDLFRTSRQGAIPGISVEDLGILLCMNVSLHNSNTLSVLDLVERSRKSRYCKKPRIRLGCLMDGKRQLLMLKKAVSKAATPAHKNLEIIVGKRSK